MMLDNPKYHTILITTGIILSALSIASIIGVTRPDSISTATLTLLYLSIFLFTAGICMLVGMFIRQRLQAGLYTKNFKISLRQGILAGVLITSSLALNAHNLLFWWVAITLVLLLAVIEIFFNLQ
jgi:hypothetical protein